MERTTSKRYEDKIPWVERSQPAVIRQRCRIQDDQKNAAMVADNLECKKTSQCANWKEVLLTKYTYIVTMNFNISTF